MKRDFWLQGEKASGLGTVVAKGVVLIALTCSPFTYTYNKASTVKPNSCSLAASRCAQIFGVAVSLPTDQVDDCCVTLLILRFTGLVGNATTRKK